MMQKHFERRIAGLALVAISMAIAGCTATAAVTVSDSAVSAAATAKDDREIATGDVDSDAAEATPTPPAEAPTVEPTATGEGCRFTEIDDFGDIQIELEFVSTIAVQDDVSVSYVLYDGNGAPIASTGTLVEDLLPGERVRMAVDTVEDEPIDAVAADGITCEIVELVPFDFGLEPFRAQAGDSCTFIELDAVGDIQVEINVANPLAVQDDLVIDFALRGPDGIRFGDGLAFTDPAAPGERIVQATDTFTDLPDWVSESTFTCEILSIQDF